MRIVDTKNDATPLFVGVEAEAGIVPNNLQQKGKSRY